jgi:hypothetical protein
LNYFAVFPFFPVLSIGTGSHEDADWIFVQLHYDILKERNGEESPKLKAVILVD